MVKKAQTLQDAEALVAELENSDSVAISSHMSELEEAIDLLMGLNYRLAGNDKSNALVASLQMRARKLRERSRSGGGP